MELRLELTDGEESKVYIVHSERISLLRAFDREDFRRERRSGESKGRVEREMCWKGIDEDIFFKGGRTKER